MKVKGGITATWLMRKIKTRTREENMGQLEEKDEGTEERANHAREAGLFEGPWVEDSAGGRRHTRASVRSCGGGCSGDSGGGEINLVHFE